MGLLAWLKPNTTPEPVTASDAWDRIPDSYWRRKRLQVPAPLPDTKECPHCKTKGFTFRQRHNVYITSCDQCGGKRAAHWFYEDNPSLHHSYSFCPDCLHTDHARCHTTSMCFVGSREMAEKWLADQWKDSPFPMLEQTR